MPNATIINKDGQEYVDIEGHEYGLGLQVPLSKSTSIPELKTLAPSLDLGAIRQIVESEDFAFGSKWFDSSWITDQNGYGSCAAYGGASALEKAIYLGGQERVELSGDYLYSLVNGGRDRGSMLDDNMDALLHKGVCLRSTVKLGQIYRNKYNTAIADAEAKRFRAHEAFALPDEAAMATALAMRMPVVVAIHVTNRWRKFDADDVLADANGPGNHCEHLDDIRWSAKHGRLEYRKGTSHGKRYSGDGYCWTYWEGHYKQASRYHQYYAVPTAIQDPQGDGPPPIDGVSPEPNPSPDPQQTRLIEMVSGEHCGWCVQWEKNIWPQAEAAGYAIRKADGSVAPGNGVPRFRLTVGDKSETKIGYWKLADIESAAKRLES